MISGIKQFLINNNLSNQKTTLVVGFSGGYDSCALLDILAKLRDTFNFKLCAAHLNHGWRTEANQDEENCKNFCIKNNIDFYSERLSNNVAKTETAAREARYEFFTRACKYFNSKNLITAHTKSDNAETLLYRVVKGTGIKGLCAIESIQTYKGISILRPMLFATRSEVEAYCKEHNLSPNNDKSNYDTKYKRNLIRHEVLPILQQINPQVENAINSLSELAKNQEELINEYLKGIYAKLRTKNVFSTKEFMELSKALKCKVIYDFILELQLDYDRKKIEEIVNFIEKTSISKSGKTHSLKTNLWLFCNNENFYTISKNDKNITNPISITNTETKYQFENYIFSIEKYTQTTSSYPPETENFAIVDLSKQTNLQLRHRKNGDIFQPFGMQQPIKLKKYLINKTIPQHMKDKLVLLCNSEEVLWVIGIGISEKLRVKHIPTHIIKVSEVQNDHR